MYLVAPTGPPGPDDATRGGRRSEVKLCHRSVVTPLQVYFFRRNRGIDRGAGIKRRAELSAIAGADGNALKTAVVAIAQVNDRICRLLNGIQFGKWFLYGGSK